MSAADDIALARALLERAEREFDPSQESEHIEEALILLETVDPLSPEQEQLIANLRMSYARSLLKQVPRFKAASFHVWLFYFDVLLKLGKEIEALSASDPDLAESRRMFFAMWGQGRGGASGRE